MSALSSAYAAPHTPIASAKRPRRSPGVNKRETSEINSPFSKIIKFNGDPSKRISNGTSSSSNSRGSSGCLINSIPHTPSKILFSPHLRHHNGTINTHERQIESLRAPQLPTPISTHDDDDNDEFNPYLFMAYLPPHSTTLIPGKVCLPPKAPELSHLPTLVLDLDETLVHCTVDPIPNADLQFPVNFNGACYQVYVRKRPYLDHFLEQVSKNFEVVLFTASQKIYAETLLNLLDPQGKWIHHRLFRDACLFVQGNFLKDLTVLDRDLKSTLIIDNSPHAYGYQINNGIPIESWFDDDDDEELLKAIAFLSDVLENSGGSSSSCGSSNNRVSNNNNIDKNSNGNFSDDDDDAEEDIKMNTTINSNNNTINTTHSITTTTSTSSNTITMDCRDPVFDVRKVVKNHFKTYQLIEECRNLSKNTNANSACNINSDNNSNNSNNNSNNSNNNNSN